MTSHTDLAAPGHPTLVGDASGGAESGVTESGPELVDNRVAIGFDPHTDGHDGAGPAQLAGVVIVAHDREGAQAGRCRSGKHLGLGIGRVGPEGAASQNTGPDSGHLHRRARQDRNLEPTAERRLPRNQTAVGANLQPDGVTG